MEFSTNETKNSPVTVNHKEKFNDHDGQQSFAGIKPHEVKIVNLGSQPIFEDDDDDEDDDDEDDDEDDGEDDDDDDDHDDQQLDFT